LRKFLADYPILLRQVKQTLVEGQARIEQERVRTYWETGQLIHAHILKHKDRAEYGAKVIGDLAKDLNISNDVLYRCVKFHQKYPVLKKVVGRPQFSWSHYRKFITIDDDKKRLALENSASRHGWSADELLARAKAEEPREQEPKEAKIVSPRPLIPLKGALFTYRLVERPTLGEGEEAGLLVDLGFGVFRSAGAKVSAKFKADDIIVSLPRINGPNALSAASRHEELPQYKFSKTGGTLKDLFTYNAYVERVIDGDTLKVRLDLGFSIWHRETLRLRGIDCPEMDTKEGQEAKAFVQSLIKEADLIVVRSSRSDKYDRYLADVFVPALQLDNKNNIKESAARPASPEEASRGYLKSQELYLNNLLLEKGFARRFDE